MKIRVRTTAPDPIAQERADATSDIAPARRELRGHDARSRTTIHGTGAMLFGSVFLAAGTFVTLCALDVIPTDDASYHAPRELVAVIGAVLFALPGASLMVHGLLGVARERRRRAARLHDPERPWRGDHRWDPRGETTWGLAPFRRRVAAVLGLSLFLFPFHWLVFGEIDAWFPRILLGLFDLVVVGVACDAVLRLLRALRYGRLDLRYDRFPFHPGEEVTLRLGVARPRDFTTLRLTLRCVEEAYETRGSGRNRSQRVVSYALHEDVLELGAGAGPAGPGRDLSATFTVPREAPGTDLSARPPRYWELHVRGETDGPDLDATFLVPVYERP